jgi:hypothetical protein
MVSLRKWPAAPIASFSDAASLALAEETCFVAALQEIERTTNPDLQPAPRLLEVRGGAIVKLDNSLAFRLWVNQNRTRRVGPGNFTPSPSQIRT